MSLEEFAVPDVGKLSAVNGNRKLIVQLSASEI